MHVTFGRVSASRWETTSYQLRNSEAVAFNGGHDCGNETVLHKKHFNVCFPSFALINRLYLLCQSLQDNLCWDDKLHVTFMLTLPLTLLSIKTQSKLIRSFSGLSHHRASCTLSPLACVTPSLTRKQETDLGFFHFLVIETVFTHNL